MMTKELESTGNLMKTFVFSVKVIWCNINGVTRISICEICFVNDVKVTFDMH